MKNLILCLSLLFLLVTTFSFGQKETTSLKAETGTLTFLGITQPISSLEEFPFPERHDFERNEEMKDRLYPFAESALPKGPDQVIQKNMGQKDMAKGLTINYDGMSNTGYPPDPNGDVGPNHYFQTINTQYQIFDKAGNSLYGPADIRNFWGTTEGVSDPVVLYDENANRWFVEIFTTSPSGSYNIMMAISTTPDPLGSFYLYTLAGLPNLPDFTKYGVWWDGYYMSANSGSYDVYAFDRSAMLAGLPTGYVRFDNAWRPGSGFHCIMPLDNDGVFAPAGTPGQFITINDDAWGGSDELWIYELDVDWTNTATATFTRTQQLTVAAFDSNFGPGWDNIYQQGTAQRLDAVPQVLNYRAQYRNFGTHQTIVCNHSVDIDNTDHAGVRWYELRDTGGSWWLYQQSTYAPDGHSRWMGAIAMNAYGDIGLAYSTSSSSLYPGLRYTGRHASDPLGTMTFAEASIWDGAYSQTYGNRWGDYFSMSVDPSDNRTFWFTGEYHGTNRRTRIAAINFGVYCAASGGCDEFISDVQFGYISNPTGCTNYGDYTAMSTDLALNGLELLTVFNGPPNYYADQCGVWVDWNSDGIFDVPGEEILMSGTPGFGPYSAIIIPPAGTTTGLKTIRIRIDYNTTPEPCDPGIPAIYGEVEDYTINVTPKEPATWSGNVDNNWHNADNWSTAFIPDATTDVIIPSTTTKCWVWAGTAHCQNITIEYGSGNDLRIWNQDLQVYGDMDFYGQLLMDHVDGRIIATENVTWHAGSRASIQANTVFEVYGDWNFQSGANVTINNGLVGFTGSGSSMIRSYEENCYFNHVVILKSSPDWASISNLSTADLHIHGDLAIEPGSIMYCYTPEKVFVGGNLVCLASFMVGDGTLVFDGADQLIFWNGTASDELYFHNLTISSSINTSIINYLTQNIAINANLVIEEGQLITNGYPLRIGGNWDNQVGPGGFVADTGRVIFDGGNYHQYCSDEYFYILELDKPLGGAFRMQGTHVECGSYDWTAGAIDVIPGGGSFTALDLYDDAIYGEYYLNPGGTINLHQDINIGSFVDLNGELHIFGGVMNIYGGDGYSYWPFNGDALISMYDGVLDFHNQGIYIYNSETYTLTENITGGTIRTAWGLWGDSPDFSPDYGIMEFYSTNDADIFTENGCYLNDVLIIKAPKEKNSTKIAKNTNSPIIDERSGKTISDGSKSNVLTLSGFLDINGSLVIESGVLDTDGNNIQIEGDWTNFVGDAGFIESTGWVIFDGYSKVSTIHTGERFYNLMHSNASAGIFGLTIMDGLFVYVYNNLDLQWSTLEMNYESKLFIGGDLFIANGAGLNADDVNNEIHVGGNWTNENSSNTQYQGFWPGNEFVVFDGVADQVLNTNAPSEDFTNFFTFKSGGDFRPNDNIQVFGFCQLHTGDWWDNVTGLTHSFYGDIQVEVNGGYYPLGTTQFNGTDQFYTNNGGTAMFGDLIIDKTGTLYLNSDMVVFNNHTTTIEEGVLNLNGNWFKSGGDININDGGEILVNAEAYLSILENLYVNSGGLLTASGTESNNATIFIDVVGNYGFEVNANGTISANHTTFYGMNQNGIWVNYGAYVDPDNAFNNCTFGVSEYGIGSARLTINNDQLLYIDNISFIDNPYFSGSFNVRKDLDYGELIISNYKGNFSGPDYEDDYYNRIHWYPGEYRLELKAFLEGPFNSTYMSPSLNSILPLNHPFNPPIPYFGNPMPDWYYLAGGSVGFIPDPGVVDWVLVQLRDATSPGAALPATAIATTPAFLMEDGTIIAMDGSPQLTFEVTPVNNLYLVIWHRNHLGVISANPLTEVGGAYPYDFSTGASQAYGGTSAQVQLSASPVIWGMMAGDGDGTGNISISDKNNVWGIQAGEEGYLESDYNLNINVNNQDKNDFWFKNNGKVTYIPE